MLVAGSMAFAQFDDSDDPLSDNYQDPLEQTEETSSDDTENSEEAKPVGSATATGDEWEGFKYEEIGLTQREFQEAKESGLTREQLTQLVELGVRPSEYLQKPWVRLGVSEEDWLSQRSEGMEDSDIDRSYRYKSGDQSYAYLSLLVPSLYQWKTNNSTIAIGIDALWVVSMGATVYLAVDGNTAWWYGLLFVAGAHVWSFADAFFHTQWDSNPDANRFSFGIMPTPDKGVASMFQVKF